MNREIKKWAKDKGFPFDPLSPSEREVTRYLALWDNLPNYRDQEKALEWLFQEHAASNSDLTNVLLKVVALNHFYSTNIFDVYEVSRKICKISDLDFRLNCEGKEMEVVEELRGCGPERRNTGKAIDIYSFATKYCAHHLGCHDRFPIYDSFVGEVLHHWSRKKNSPFSAKLKGKDLKQYEEVKKAVVCFKEIFKLKKLPQGFSGVREITLRDVDRYLWQFGKDWFPKKYGKQKTAKGDNGVIPTEKLFEEFAKRHEKFLYM